MHSLVLKPGNTFGPGSTRAVRGAGPPYSSRYSHHRGNCCVIRSSSIEAIRIHVQRRLCPCASPRRPQLLVVCTHFGSFLKKQNKKYRLGVIGASFCSATSSFCSKANNRDNVPGTCRFPGLCVTVTSYDCNSIAHRVNMFEVFCIEYKYLYTKTIFHACVPRIAKLSRYVTAI